MPCDDCRFWSLKSKATQIGECRRHAPPVGTDFPSLLLALVATSVERHFKIDDDDEKLKSYGGDDPIVEALEAPLLAKGTFVVWPETFDSDWCGEWKEKQ